MPRYLRWIVAVTTGIVIQFAFQILLLAVVVRPKPGEVVTLSGAAGALITFGATIINVIAALAVNEWLSARYPVVRKAPIIDQDAEDALR